MRKKKPDPKLTCLNLIFDHAELVDKEGGIQELLNTCVKHAPNDMFSLLYTRWCVGALKDSGVMPQDMYVVQEIKSDMQSDIHKLTNMIEKELGCILLPVIVTVYNGVPKSGMSFGSYTCKRLDTDEPMEDIKQWELVDTVINRMRDVKCIRDNSDIQESAEILDRTLTVLRRVWALYDDNPAKYIANKFNNANKLDMLVDILNTPVGNTIREKKEILEFVDYYGRKGS